MSQILSAQMPNAYRIAFHPCLTFFTVWHDVLCTDTESMINFQVLSKSSERHWKGHISKEGFGKVWKYGPSNDLESI